jgi:hypothetical protein
MVKGRLMVAPAAIMKFRHIFVQTVGAAMGSKNVLQWDIGSERYLSFALNNGRSDTSEITMLQVV